MVRNFVNITLGPQTPWNKNVAALCWLTKTIKKLGICKTCQWELAENEDQQQTSYVWIIKNEKYNSL